MAIVFRAVFALAASCLLFTGGAAFAQKGKPTVGIYRIDDVANSGQADSFSTMIETAITTTNKFRVIERQRVGKLLSEQGNARAGVVTTNRPGKIGGFEGADFLIYGTITSVSVVTKQDVGSSLVAGMFSNGRGASCSNTVATVAIDIKITDASSGEVRYATRLTETRKSAANCTGNNQVETTALLRGAADKIATALVTTIYPVQIAAVQTDGTIVLNYGEGAILPGAVMTVFIKGEAIRDPATGEVIANNETRIGLIKIVDVGPRVSKAAPASPFSAPAAIGQIVRVATPADLQATNPKGKKR